MSDRPNTISLSTCKTYNASDHVQLEEALKESEEQFRATFEQAAVGIAHVDLNGRFMRANRKLCEIVGYAHDELIKLTPQDLTHPEDLDTDLDHIRRLLAGEIQTFSFEKRYVRKDRESAWVNLTVSLVRKSSGEPKYLIKVVEDITDRKKAVSALRESEKKYRRFIDAAAEGFWMINSQLETIEVNEALCKMLGYTQEEMLGKKPFDFVDDENHRIFKEQTAKIPGTSHRRYDIILKAKSGQDVYARFNATTIRDSANNYISSFAFVTDITEQKRTEEMLNSMAYYDSLTGLPNRTLFYDRFELAIAHARRDNGMLAVLFLDLDNFKTINDTLGHAVGDQLLQGVAGRLKGGLREGDTIARLGGDEFVLLLSGISSSKDASGVAEKVLSVFSAPFTFDGQELHITTSVGISLYPYDGEDSQTLLKNADAALYRAKEHGRNDYQLYTPALGVKDLERLTFDNNMRKVLEKEEFVVYYQPQISLSSGKIVGMETLIRWQHPKFGLVYQSKNGSRGHGDKRWFK